MGGMKLRVFSEEDFRLLVEKEGRRAVRYEYFFSIAMIKVNDSNPEHVPVVDLARVVSGSIRGSDIIGMIGSDRISVILPFSEDPEKFGVRMLQRIRREFPDVHIRISVACFPSDAVTAKDLFRRLQQGPDLDPDRFN